MSPCTNTAQGQKPYTSLSLHGDYRQTHMHTDTCNTYAFMHNRYVSTCATHNKHTLSYLVPTIINDHCCCRRPAITTIAALVAFKRLREETFTQYFTPCSSYLLLFFTTAVTFRTSGMCQYEFLKWWSSSSDPSVLHVYSAASCCQPSGSESVSGS